MKQQIHTFIMGSLTLLAIYFYFLSTQPLQAEVEIKQFPTLNPSNEETKALNYINYIRAKSGLIPFESHPILKEAAKNHANYLTNHLAYGHAELPQYSDYTGKFASNRIRKIGFSTSKVIENVSANNKNYKESIDGLFAAIYHRQAFLDFRPDIMGIGVSQNKQKKDYTAFVYDMSSKALEELHKKNPQPTERALNRALQSNRKKNSPLVIYPYDKQRNVPPAFFDELPDPLPEHRVSGYPISISFNPDLYKEVKLLKFKLYNAKGQEIKDTLTYTYETDIHHRLGRYDFVLFPLKRLKWNRKYKVVFVATIQNKLVKKEWSFHTQRFKMPFYRIKHRSVKIKIKVLKPVILYFPPTSKVDILSSIAYPKNFDIEFIDKNTIKLTLLKLEKRSTLRVGRFKVTVMGEE